MEEIYPQYEELKQVVSNENIDVPRALALVKQLRLKMLKIPFLSPEGENIYDDVKIVLRHILEIAARVEILADDIKSFLRTMENLKICYFQYQKLPKSEDMELFFSLYLVALLSQNELIKFNLEYESIHPLIPESQLITYAVNLGKAISDNSFAQIYALKSNPPSPLYHYILKSILDGARESHADSIQRAYPELSIIELAQILHFKPDKAVAFAEKRGWRMDEKKENVYFRKEVTRQALDTDSFTKSIRYCVTVASLA